MKNTPSPRRLGLLVAGLLAASTAAARPLTSAGVHPMQVADRVYPSDPAQLREQVDAFIAGASSAAPDGEVLAVLAPHSAYAFSGRVAGAAYAALRGHIFDTVIVLGTGHGAHIPGVAVSSAAAFATPFGPVDVDTQAVRALMAADPDVRPSAAAFLDEPSIEAQLPFLERSLASDYRLVPLLVNSEDPGVADRLGDALASLLRAGNTLLVASADMSQYPQKDKARAADTATLRELAQGPTDPARLRRHGLSLRRRGGQDFEREFCSEAVLAAALRSLVPFGTRARILDYGNSGEMPGGNPEHAVGFGAVRWTRGAPEVKPPLPPALGRELLGIARHAIEEKLAGRSGVAHSVWREPDFNRAAAVFVTLRDRRTYATRGTYGSIDPEAPLAEAVQRYAQQAAFDDGRFVPLASAGGPAGVSVELTVPGPAVPLGRLEDVRFGQGIELVVGGRSAILLPRRWDNFPKNGITLQTWLWIQMDALCTEPPLALKSRCWQSADAKLRAFDAQQFTETGASR